MDFKKYILIILVFVILSSLSSAHGSQVIGGDENISVAFSLPSVIRNGANETVALVHVINNNKDNVSIILKKVSILREDGAVTYNLEPNKNLDSTVDLFERAGDLKEEMEDYSSPEGIEEYEQLSLKLINNTFSHVFYLDLQEFDSSITVGDIIEISARLEFEVNGGMKNITEERDLLISERLPSPLHNSPGWYAGDQHVHSNYGWHLWEPFIDPLGQMVSSGIGAGLDWIIFTDHSFALDISDWTQGYANCTGYSTSSFKCLYGQEMSVGQVPWACDANFNGHYLAYPYSDDNLSYVEGSCGPFPNCNCREEQETITEINSLGGMGFIAHPHLPSGGASIHPITLSVHHFNWDNWSTTGMSGLEIINSEFTSDDSNTISNTGSLVDSWVEFLERETNPSDGFTVGLGNSDAHYIADIGDTFTYCYIPTSTLTTTSIRDSIKQGHCIASEGPFVSFNLDNKMIGDSVNVSSGSNILSINASSNFEFGQLQVLKIYLDDDLYNTIPLSGFSYSSSANIVLNPSNKFIRMEVVTNNSRHAYTNPIWLNVTDCQCSAWTPGTCGGGSCSAGQRSYSRTCSPSSCAAQNTCIFDNSCIAPPISSQLASCTEPGYEFCAFGQASTSTELCTNEIAQNLYERVNTIRWGQVNTSLDPYVVGQYNMGWRGVDSKLTYYNVANPNSSCSYGGCSGGSLISNDDGTITTVTAPGLASVSTLVAYDDTTALACWTWWNSFNPGYTVGSTSKPLYIINCFESEDCSSNSYCNKTGTWNQWSCVSEKNNGQSCNNDFECQSGYCDKDNLGLSDDGWCFTPTNTYFDGQESTYCEFSTDQGSISCDERQVGDDLNVCNGVSYREDECSSICGMVDRTNTFECNDVGCSCGQPLCDGLISGSNVTSCSGGESYFADSCTFDANSGDRGDKTCRSFSFANGCTADSQCNGVVAGTGQCNLDCTYNSQLPSNTTLLSPIGGQVFNPMNLINISWNISFDPEDNPITYNLQYSNNSGTNWYSIISNYGYTNKLNDSSTSSLLQFSGNQNKTIYLRIPKMANVVDAKLNIKGMSQ